MKKIFIGCLGFLVIIVTGFVLVFLLTSNMVGTTDKFFTAVKEKDFEKAYEYTSEEFQAGTSLESLKRFLEQSAIIDYKAATWNSRSITQNQGQLKGALETIEGGTIPVEVSLVKEEGGWRIQHIRKQASGIEESVSEKTIPPEEELKKMTNESMLLLAEAINAEDFSEFHAGISRLWQSQMTEEELLEIFKPFTEIDVDLTFVKNLEPVFSEPPKINEDELLLLKGYYPSKPPIVNFDLKYIYEYPDWELFGIQVNLK